MKKTRLCFVNFGGPFVFINRLKFGGYWANLKLTGYKTNKPLLVQRVGEINVGDVVESFPTGSHFKIAKIKRLPPRNGAWSYKVGATRPVPLY